MKKLTFLFFVFSFSFFILKAQTGIISTIAGDAGIGYNGDNRQATTAELNQDGGVAIDKTGNIYIADFSNHRIRKVSAAGVITTIAGNGFSGFSGDGGQATAAQISFPECVRVDTLGNIYFSEAGNAIIRKINNTGRISTIAGLPGIGGFTGNGGQATSAELNNPVGIGLDRNLNVYIADQVNNEIRKINASTGVITDVAGNHAGGYSGNGGQATNAELNQPTGVAVDEFGNIFIADYMNNVIRKVTSVGIISTYAGTTVANFNGFGGLADTTELFNPTGVSVSPTGNVYIADAGNGVVREVFTATNQMYVIAGIVDDGYSGDGGPAISAEVNYPFDMMEDASNNVYIADLGNNRIRKITAGCAGNQATIGVYNYPECHGFTDGILEGFTNSNFEPYTYHWSNGPITMKDSALSAGTYTVGITDALGCMGTASVNITQPPAITVTTGNYTVCQNSDVKLSSSATGGSGGFSYIWVTGSTYDTTTIQATTNATYTIYAIDNTGCIDSAEANVTVNFLPLVLLNAERYNACSTDSSDSLSGSPAGGTYAGPNLTGNVFNPSLAGVGTWNFTYSYTDSNGCTAVATQSVIVSVCTGVQNIAGNERITVYPNPASDQFTVQLQSGDAAQMISIYNVTGQQVYAHKYSSTENSQLSTINFQALSTGVYFLKVVLQDGSTLVQKIDIVK